MIKVRIFACSGTSATPTDLGELEFVVLPRVGEDIELDRAPIGKVGAVASVLHTPSKGGAPACMTIFVTV
jgi:hypothetical protein